MIGHEVPFLTEIREQPEQPKSPREYERQELENDISAFPDYVQPLVQKFLSDEGLTAKERSIFDRARQDWWHEKYGFSYTDKAVRNEFLLRKYAPPEELSKARQLQDGLFRAFKSGDREQIDEVRKRYEDEYPDQLIGVTALFEIVPYLSQHTELEKKLPSEQRMEKIEECTQDAFLLTHFLSSNTADKEFVRLFWGAAEKLAKDAGQLKALNRLRRGILSQVAVKKAFDALGLKAKLSHPKEDAFQATDLWTEGGEAIQVKGHWEGAAIVPTDEVSPVGVQVKGDDGELHFDSYLNREMQKFRLKLDRYGRSINQRLKGYLVRIPYSEFDAITGEPTENIIDFIRQELERAGVGLGSAETTE